MTRKAVIPLGPGGVFGVLLIVIAVAYWFPAKVSAADWKLVPKIGLSGGYDDNVLFRKDEKISSSLINLEPGIELGYETLVSSIQLTAEFEILRYFEENDLDQEDQYYRLAGRHQIGPRWDARYGFRYSKDSTLKSYLEEVGRIIDRIDREYYYTMGGVKYNLSTISSIDTQYRFERAVYDDDRYSDYDRHRINLRYEHRLKSQQDTISIGPSFYYRTNDFNDTEYISLDLGWERDWSKITNTFASIGGRYANVDDNDNNGDGEDESRNEWGVRARFNLRRQGLASMFTLRYYHDVDTTAAGTDVNVDNFRLWYDYRLTERFNMGFYGRLVLSYDLFGSSDEEDVDSGDSRYFEIRPFVSYRLTEQLNVSLNYGYQNSSEDLVDSEDTRERNRVWLQLYYESPDLL